MASHSSISPELHSKDAHPAHPATVGGENQVGQSWTGCIRLSLVGFIAILVLASWVVLATVHVDDRFAVDHVAGARMALAQDANNGVLYRPLYDGRNYGGTRFMPIPIVLHAGIARVTHEYMESGKLLSYGSIVLMLGVMFLVLRRHGSPLPVALAFIAAVVATEPGLLAATGISGDALPVALQLGAVALVGRSLERKWLMAAAALCVLALFVKLSAVWAPLAIGTWLLMKNRRKLIPFAVSLFAFFTAMLGLFLWVTGGRLWANVFGLSFSGVSGPGSVLRPTALPGLLLERMNALVVLIPVAAVAWFAAWFGDRITIHDVSLVWALAILLVVLTDVGTDYNHLLDVVVLAVIVVGESWSLMGDVRPRLIRTSVPLVLAAVLAATWVVTMAGPTRDAFASALGHARGDHFARDPLSGYLQPDDNILSEDPSIPVELNLRPMILDPFMVREFESAHPSWIDDLVERIDTREFDKVVLLKDLEAAPDWYMTWHFGPRVFGALRANYVLAGWRHGYFLYVPKS
jgi:hypothetical protein